jgi:hypothetical protein
MRTPTSESPPPTKNPSKIRGNLNLIMINCRLEGHVGVKKSLPTIELIRILTVSIGEEFRTPRERLKIRVVIPRNNIKIIIFVVFN